ADDRPPVGPVGVDAPDAPAGAVAQALRFERAEDDPAVLQDDRVQGAADVEVADLLDVRAVVVHDEQLHAQVMPLPGRYQAGPVADDGDAAARQRTGVHVADGPAGGRPAGAPGIGGPLLPRQALGLARLDVDLVDVGTTLAAGVVEVGVVDVLRVE